MRYPVTKTRIILKIKSGMTFALIGSLCVDTFAIDTRCGFAFVDIYHKIIILK